MTKIAFTFLTFILINSYSYALDSIETQKDSISNQMETHLEQVEIISARNDSTANNSFSRLQIDATKQLMNITNIETLLIKKQGITDIKEVINNITGFYNWATFGNVQNIFGSRGYRGATFLRNGIVLNNFNSSPDIEGVESLQAVKGASGIYFGGISPGGAINYITKRPLYEAGGRIKLLAGEWAKAQPSFDIYGALNKNKTLAYRVNGSYRYEKSFREQVENQSFFVNPSFEWRISPKTLLTIEYDFSLNSKTPDNGTIIYRDGENNPHIYDMPNDKYVGFKSDKVNTLSHNLGATLNHSITPSFDVKISYFYQNFNMFSQRVGRNSNLIDNSSTLKRTYTKSNLTQNQSFIIAEIIGKELKTWKFKHNVYIGTDVLISDNIENTFNEVAIDTVDVINGDIDNNVLLPSLEMGKVASSKDVKFGITIQDNIIFTKWLELTLGVRYNGFFGNNRVSGSSFSYNGFTPSAGIMFNIIPELSAFGNYTYTVDPKNSSFVDVNGDYIGPEITQQLEFGLRSSSFNGKLNMSFSLFHIFNTGLIGDVHILDSEGVYQEQDYYAKTGELRNQGAEFEIRATPISGLDINAGYTYLDARYKKSSHYADNSVPFNTPEHLANIWIGYTFQRGWAKNLSLGLGYNYIGERFANDMFKVDMPEYGVKAGDIPMKYEGYHLLRATLGYTYKRVSFMMNFNNITNTKAYTSYRNAYVNQINPFNTTLSISYFW